MKTRQGFVSNSSSSSFIVAAKDSKVKIEIEIDLEDYCKGYYGSDVTIFKTRESLTAYYLSNYYVGSIEKLSESDPIGFKDYQRCLTEIESGKTVYVGSASSESDDGVEQMICNNGLSGLIPNKDVVVIRGKGGY